MLALVEDGQSREIHYEFEAACKANICLITAKLVFQVIRVDSFQKLLLLVLSFNSLLVVLRFNTFRSVQPWHLRVTAIHPCSHLRGRSLSLMANNIFFLPSVLPTSAMSTFFRLAKCWSIVIVTGIDWPVCSSTLILRAKAQWLAQSNQLAFTPKTLHFPDLIYVLRV